MDWHLRFCTSLGRSLRLFVWRLRSRAESGANRRDFSGVSVVLFVGARWAPRLGALSDQRRLVRSGIGVVWETRRIDGPEEFLRGNNQALWGLSSCGCHSQLSWIDIQSDYGNFCTFLFEYLNGVSEHQIQWNIEPCDTHSRFLVHFEREECRKTYAKL